MTDRTSNIIQSETRTKIISIDLMRVACSYMVVAAHMNPFKEVNGVLAYVFKYVLQGVAVPFFFVVSGYFFTKSLIKDSSVTFTYLKRLIRTYTLWSLIYFICGFLLNIVDRGILVSFLFFGSWYHLWYFPALFFCVIISSAFNKYKKLKGLAIVSILLYIIGILGCSYYSIGIEIPILNQLYKFSEFTLIRRVFLTGVPFFMLGYFIQSINYKLDKIKNDTLIKLLIVTTFFFILEIILVNILKMQENVFITVFIYPLIGIILILCLKNPMDNISSYGNYLKYTANFTYYAHPLFIKGIDILSIIINKIIGISITETPMFILVCILTTVTTWIIYKLNIKWLIKFIL